ncbi:hypothetical protein GYMC10_1439 [Paenibacillus sp. Y412MC10]|nr:hypothetical protein GYMC10_1439 [Paenibacillus sp. Y412MC10]
MGEARFHPSFLVTVGGPIRQHDEDAVPKEPQCNHPRK